MRLLLDTHVLLWALGAPERLPGTFRRLLEDAGNEILFSAASIWEISIKAALGQVDFGVQPAEVLDAAGRTGFAELPVTGAVAAWVAGLPLHHRDPFDRLLVAQALAGPMRLYTADAALLAYSELVTMVG